jgi:hypothetical protein
MLPDNFQAQIDKIISDGTAARMLRAGGTDNIFEADCLDVASKITGKRYDKDEGTSALGFLLLHAKNQLWEAQAKKSNDTIFTMNMVDYLKIVESLGFKKILEVPFFKQWEKKEIEQKQYHYWRDGLLLVCDTFGGDPETFTRNSANVYCNLIPKDLESSIFEVPT